MYNFPPYFVHLCWFHFDSARDFESEIEAIAKFNEYDNCKFKEANPEANVGVL